MLEVCGPAAWSRKEFLRFRILIREKQIPFSLHKTHVATRSGKRTHINGGRCNASKRLVDDQVECCDRLVGFGIGRCYVADLPYKNGIGSPVLRADRDTIFVALAG